MVCGSAIRRPAALTASRFRLSPVDFLARTASALALVAGAAALVGPPDARAATADVLSKGRVYCASTHPNHGTIAGFGAAVDLNGRTDDTGWPIYAPGEGRVRVFSVGGGFGLSVIWTAANGRERIHLAHLGSFGHTGSVRAGTLIGRIGSTGQSTGSHLHAAASIAGRPATLVLGGRAIIPGRCYTSRGPIPPRCLSRDATMIGTGGRDRVVGSAADDVIVTGASADRVKGRGGDDVICGEKGADTLIGGGGEDRLGGGSVGDALRGGPAGDRILGASGQDLLAGGRGSDVARAGAGRDRLLGERGADRLSGGPAGDRLRGAARADTLAGGQGEDLLIGGRGRDRIRGEGEDDDLFAGAGADVLSGGRGRDALRAGRGDDRLHGNDDEDRLAGAGGDDRLEGGRGRDVARFARSAAGVSADLGLGTAIGEGEDELVGVEGLRGSPRPDSLTGDGRDNEIWGGAGDDVLDGRGGENRLDGGEGFDICMNAATKERCEGDAVGKAARAGTRSR